MGYLKEYALYRIRKGLSNNMTCANIKFIIMLNLLNISFQQVKKRLEDMSEQDLIVSVKPNKCIITLMATVFKYVK